jgi:hypothetical protein
VNRVVNWPERARASSAHFYGRITGLLVFLLPAGAGQGSWAWKHRAGGVGPTGGLRSENMMAEIKRTRRNTLERRCLGKSFKRLFVKSPKSIFKMLEKVKRV